MTDGDETPVGPERVGVGDKCPKVVIEDVGRTDFVKYAGASGDFHRVHFDEQFAKQAGYESVFQQGMLTAGYAASMISGWFGVANINRFRTRFTDIVWPGDTITVEGVVTERASTDGTTEVEVEFEAVNQEETVVLTGDATVEIPE